MREDHENGEETKVDSTTTPTPGLKGDLVQQHTAKAAMEDLVSLLACMDKLRVVLIMLHKKRVAQTVDRYRLSARGFAKMIKPRELRVAPAFHDLSHQPKNGFE